MEFFHGSLELDGTVICEALEGWVEVVAPPGRLSSWHGGFRAPATAHSDLFSTLSSAEPCTLKLDDGRKGQMFINHMSLAGEEVQFQGTGPLE